MAIANVQRVNSDNGNTNTKTITVAATAAGNLLVVMVGYDFISGAGTGVLNVPTDNKGSTYVLATNSHVGTVGTLQAAIYYVANCQSGITTITITSANENYIHNCATVEEWSGAATSSPLDVAGSVIQSSSPLVGPTLTPTVAGELMTGLVSSNNVVVTGVSAPFSGTARNTVLPTCFANQINPALSAVAAAFTPTTAGNFVSTMAIFKPTPAGPSNAVKSGAFLATN